MKKTFILLPLVGLLCYTVLSSNSTGPGFASGLDCTGASGAAVGCGSGLCHSTVASPSITVTIQLYDAATGTVLITNYVGGTAYKLRITGNNTGGTSLPKFGFQLAVMKSGSTTVNEGTLSAGIGVSHVGTYAGIKISEHGAPFVASGTGSTYTVDIPWIAPVAGTGDVKAFATLNAVNGDGLAGPTDLWNNTSLVIHESTGFPAITGTMTVCTGATTALTDATTGGTWSSLNSSVATVASTGVVTGVSAGTAIISYNDGTTGSASTTVTVTTGTPTAITGPTVVCTTTHIILSDAVAGGVWSSSATGVATAGTNGVISGVTAGSTTISYTVTNACGTGTVTHTVTVKPLGGTCVSAVNPTTAIGTELKVFPNPNSGSFTVNLQSDENTQADVVITNMVGETIKEFTTMTNKETEVTIYRPVGIYFLTARTTQGIYVSRVLLQ